MFGDAEHFPCARQYTDDTHSHRRPGAQLLVLSSRNWSVFLKRLYHGTSREGSGSLSMQSVGYTQWRSTNASRGSSSVIQPIGHSTQ